MIQVAFSLPDDIGTTLGERARNEGFDDLSDYLRSLAEAEAGGEHVWEVTPCIAEALREAEIASDSPHTFDEIIANAKREVGVRLG